MYICPHIYTYGHIYIHIYFYIYYFGNCYFVKYVHFIIYLFVECLSITCALYPTTISFLAVLSVIYIKIPDASLLQCSSFVNLFFATWQHCIIWIFVTFTSHQERVCFSHTIPFIHFSLSVYPKMFTTWTNCVFNHLYSGWISGFQCLKLFFLEIIGVLTISRKRKVT